MSAAVAAAQAPGQATFMGRCNGCHGSGRNGAPAVEVLATKAPADIVTALTTGKMAAMGAALSAEDKANVAMFLTKKPV
jgi:mono/diheme cytochrome c family protein